MTIQDQYISTLAKTQETWAGVVEALTNNMNQAFDKTDGPASQIDPNAAIDQVFDYWEKALGAQREAAHQFVAATVTATEKVRAQAETVSASIKEHVESVTKAVTEHAPSK